MQHPALDLTLVIDIGKSNAKLLMVSSSGDVIEQHTRGNVPVTSPLGYPALDIDGLTQWVCTTLAASPHTRRCGHAIASTHGTAFVALGDEGLAWQPLDYEFEGCAQPGNPLHAAYQRERDPFADTLSPDLPMGLNAGRQLYWLQHTHPAAWAATRTLLPYPQYWAWWLSGVAATELSSLGCHTQLWLPVQASYSRLAQSQGWAALFAPLKPAWETLGTVRPELVKTLGLPPNCQVHVGVHDSNACLARHLRLAPNTILVSTGTWCVVMAPGASHAALDPQQDQLANVSVLGQTVPTARFMAGREFARLSAESGPVLAAQACAGTTAQLVLGMQGSNAQTVMVEGPMAANSDYMIALANLLPTHAVWRSTDPLEGTARGAWMLAHWEQAGGFQRHAERVISR